MTGSALLDSPSHACARLLLAHGAGAPMDSPFMAQFSRYCVALGIETVRFEFPYMAKRRNTGRKNLPDRQPALLAAWQQTIDAYAVTDLPLFIGGKSMGGRMATLWLAQNPGARIAGAVCLGYPFHPSGQREKRRIDHLTELSTPVLIVQGTRDKLGSRAEVLDYELGAAVQLVWLESGDHDLKPLKRSGFSHDQHIKEASLAVARFIAMDARRSLSSTQAQQQQ